MITETPANPKTAKPFNWALWGSLLVFLAVSIGAFIYTMVKCHGHFTYCFDDPYIHLAIAKNLERSGLFGVTPFRYSPASSSLIWPFMLALGIKIFGAAGEYVPVVLNILFAGGILWVADGIMRRQSLHTALRVGVMMGILFLVPMLPIMFCGMEHVLQSLVTLGFIGSAAYAISQDKKATAVLVLAPFTTLVRFEGMFIAGLVMVLFILKKRYWEAAVIAVLAALPILAFGIYSLVQGGFFFPNSVYLKGAKPDFSSMEVMGTYLTQWYHRLLTSPYMLFLLLGAAVVFTVRCFHKGFFEEIQLGLILFCLMTMVHMQTNPYTWFYRYESYLLCTGIVFVTMGTWELIRHYQVIKRPFGQQLPVWGGILLILALLGVRGFQGTLDTPQGSENIYDQQRQMAEFLKTYYSRQVVAANDIGAINYYADIDCLDLVGLASIDVAKKLVSNQMATPEQVHNVAQEKGAKIAVIYDHWFKDRIPSQWTKIASWRIENNVVCGGPYVSFYAIDPKETQPLLSHLKEFEKRLPPDVSVFWE